MAKKNNIQKIQKAHIKTYGQLVQKSKNKSKYNYYTSDSDNDGVADVNDISDYDSTVQDYGDIPKKKINRTKLRTKTKSDINNEKTDNIISSKKPNLNKLDRKIIKKKNRLIFEENKPKGKAFNNTGVVIVGAGVVSKDALDYINQVESLKDSDSNSAVQAVGKGFDLTSNKTNKKLTKLNKELRLKTKKVNIRKLEKKSARLKYNATFDKTLKKNEVYKNSKGLNKYYQRFKIKKQYNKKVKGSVVQVFQKGIKKATIMMKKIALIVIKRFGIYIAGAILIIIIGSMFINLSVGLFSSGVSMIVSTSYQTNDIEITEANDYYQFNEANLLYAVENVKKDYPDYNEYRYDVASIGHNPHELVAYLTAKYSEFTQEQVNEDLIAIFDEQYTYSLTDIIETRTKTITVVTIDPDTGETITSDIEVEYDWYVLEIKLTNSNLEQILLLRLNDEQKEQYTVLLETKGNFISFPSPINKEWYSSISSPFGYRLDPMTNEVAFHNGVDIAQPEGTELIAIFNGTVLYTGYDADGYGNYVIIEQEEIKQTALYGHCISIEVAEGSEIKAGDVVAKVGSTGKSTGNHVHFEIRDSNGNKLNPYFYLFNSPQIIN